MNIFLSGSNGMVGKNILEFYKSEEHTFYTPSSKELNLLNLVDVEEYIADIKPDLIIHAAGLVGGIQANIAEPVKFLVNNMYIGLNVINTAYKYKVPKFLNLSSSCMYPRNAKNPLKEEYILKGELEPTNEGYALAKVAAAKLCEYIVRENPAFQYKTIMPCNLYGKHDKFDEKTSHMIPAVIKKLSDAIKNNKRIVNIWGDGTARREFMYAEDLADFIYYAIENFHSMPQYLNVGQGYDYSIKEYYEHIAKVVGYTGQFSHDLSKPAGMKQKLVDITLLEKFGWKSKHTLEEGLQKTYQYYVGLK